MFVANAGGNPKSEAPDDGSAIGSDAGLEHGFGFKRAGVEPGNARRSAIGDKNFAVIGDRARSARKPRQNSDMAPAVGIDHLDHAPRRMSDEDAAAFRIKDAVIEGAAGGSRNIDHADSSQRHDGLMSSPGHLLFVETSLLSMCNLPGNCRALHRAWTASRLAGSLCFPVRRT